MPTPIIVRNNDDEYEVLKKVAENNVYRMYLCEHLQTGRECLLQIGLTDADNSRLERFAYILKELKSRAAELEKEFAKVKGDPKDMLNYGLGFPDLINSFIYTDRDGDRRVNVFVFNNIANAGDAVPLINITEKDSLRVDLKTSVWIMGKALKLLAFTQSEGFAIKLVSSDNILLDPEKHYVLFFDLMATQIYPDGVVPEEVCRQEIAKAAQAVIVVLGGDPETEYIPSDDSGDRIISEDDDKDDEGDSEDDDDSETLFFSHAGDGQEKDVSRYTDYLLYLARGDESNAKRAHERFYEIVDSLWPRKFHPFTTLPLESSDE